MLAAERLTNIVSPAMPPVPAPSITMRAITASNLSSDLIPYNYIVI